MNFLKTICVFFIIQVCYCIASSSAVEANNVLIDDTPNNEIIKIDSNSRDSLFDNPLLRVLLPDLIQKQKRIQKRSPELIASLLGGGGGGSGSLLSLLGGAAGGVGQQSNQQQMLYSSLGINQQQQQPQQQATSNLFSQFGMGGLTGTNLNTDFSRIQGAGANIDLSKILGSPSNSNSFTNLFNQNLPVNSNNKYDFLSNLNLPQLQKQQPTNSPFNNILNLIPQSRSFDQNTDNSLFNLFFNSPSSIQTTTPTTTTTKTQ